MKRLSPLIVAAAVLAGCTGEPAESGPTGGPFPLAGDAGACTVPEEGCACDPGSEPIDCYLDPVEVDGMLVCNAGTRFCRAGAWSSCESLRSYTIGNPMALIDGPSECNPCNPDCSVARDYPTDRDIGPGNSTDVSYDPTAPGLVITAMPPPVPLPDADGDLVPDVADECPGPGWRAPCDGSATDDGFYHALPFGGASAIDPLDITTQVRTADVYFLVDTTGSMGGEINNLRTALTTGTLLAGCGGGIIGAIRCTIPDAWFGVGRHDDYPVNPYGDSGTSDYVYQNLLDITPDTAAAQAAVTSLGLHWGYDWPESQSQALWAVATGGGLGPYLAPKAACPAGRWGYPCFRPGTIPIVILFTDATFHNGSLAAYDYAPMAPLPAATAVANTNETFATAYGAGDVTAAWVGFSGSTQTMAHDVSPGCGSTTARDAVYSFTLTATTTVTITLQGSSFNTVLGLYNGAMALIQCNDNAPGLGTRSAITRSLAAGTYYVVVDGNGTSRGSYRLSLGVPPYPVTWAQALAALNARGVKTIVIESCGSGGWCPETVADAIALANATGSVDGTGSPFVFSISDTGTGLSTAVVDAVRDLANYSRMDVSAVAVDNPATAAIDERGFVNSITAVSYPAGRCTGISGGTVFTACLPGTTVNFRVTFRNDFVMPTMVPQVFDFWVQVLGDGIYELALVPVRIVVPPLVPIYPAEGRYWRDYDSTARCVVPPQRPDWNAFRWTATTPAGTSIRFEIRTASTLAGLPGATPVSINVPGSAPPVDIGNLLIAGGQPNQLPYLRVTSRLFADPTRTITPVLSGFELDWICTSAE